LDWARAIERNSEALKAIVAALFVMLGSATVGRIPRPLHRAVLSVLRPAEAAMRRLIVIAARGLVVKPMPSRPKPQVPIKRGNGQCRHLAFPLFDPRKRFAHQRRRGGPRSYPRAFVLNENYELVTLLDTRPRRKAANPDGQVDAARLSARLEALKRALDDVPRQARRLVRARARRDKVPRLRLQSPMRPGRPPGHRKVPVHEVDHVLAECHWLARDVEAHDTS
jgi:hypothetical protein